MLTKFQKCKKLQQGKKFYINRGKSFNRFNFCNFCNFCIATFVTLVTIYTFATSIVFAGIAGTKHDMSITGTGIKATAETQRCVFCHTPHSSTKAGPLWNHSLSSATYVVCNPASLCGSTTQISLPGQPDGSSRLCLGCHDGTVAVGLLVNMPGPAMAGTVEMTQTYMTGTSLLGTNLTGKHIVSIVINQAFIDAKTIQCASDKTMGIKFPDASSPVKLYATNNTYGSPPTGGKGIQCRTCHDPHEDSGDYKCFLVHVSGITCTTCPCGPSMGKTYDNDYTALCYKCHYTCP